METWQFVAYGMAWANIILTIAFLYIVYIFIEPLRKTHGVRIKRKRKGGIVQRKYPEPWPDPPEGQMKTGDTPIEQIEKVEVKHREPMPHKGGFRAREEGGL